MSTFRTVAEPGRIPVLLVGAGAMGRHWMGTLTASSEVELVSVVDLDVDLARRAVREEGLDDVLIGASVADAASGSGACAVIDVTVPAAHRPVNEEALRAGLPVLCEKPIAPTLTEAIAQAAISELTGELLMTSQSRRYYDNFEAFRDLVRTLGDVGVVTTEFFKAPHFGGFREEMEHPLLVDMAIHQFDAARHLLGANPIAVTCTSYNPTWSWFRGDAAATAVFELERDIRYVYTGSWCSPGLETSWNGRWRVSGAQGTATWDGDGLPRTEAGDAPRPVSGHGEETAGALAEFVAALRTGRMPSGEIHSNIWSLAMVEAAVLSAHAGGRVVLADLLERRYGEALTAERRLDVRAQLLGWGSAAAGLGVESSVSSVG